jgi:hypothetical protein
LKRPSRRISIVVVLVASMLSLGIGTLTHPARGADAANAEAPAMKLATLGFKFNGANSCKGSGCHNEPGKNGKAADLAPPPEGLHEWNIWNKKDNHAKAFNTLATKDSKDIVAKLKIADATKSDKCLSCHALKVDKPLQGANFKITEGNTCENCHGPSEKWLKDHADPKWQDAQRASMDHDKLMTTLGVYDTRPVVVRAELCASCHLSIDADMVAAGHPLPSFEMAYGQMEEPKHWQENHFKEPEGFANTKIWMAGQVVCVREAMNQLSARVKAGAKGDAINDAYHEALAHAMVFQPAVAIVGLDEKEYTDNLTKLAGMKPDAGADVAATADKIAAVCDAKKAAAKLDPWKADQDTTVKLLQALAKMQGMGAKCDLFGVDQQSRGLYSLYASYWSGTHPTAPESDLEKDSVASAIKSKLLPKEPPSNEDFDKAVPTIAGQLPTK